MAGIFRKTPKEKPSSSPAQTVTSCLYLLVTEVSSLCLSLNVLFSFSGPKSRP